MAWWEQPRQLTVGYVAVWRDPDGPARILAVAVLTAVVHFLGIVAFARGGIPAAIAAAVGAVLGPVGIWGVGIGALIGELAIGGTPAFVAFVPLGTLVSAVIGRTLWLQLAYPHRIRPLVAAAAILPVAAVGTLVGTALAVGLAAAFGTAGFAPSIPTMLARQLPLALVLAPPIAAAGAEWWRVPVSGMTIRPARWLASVCLTGVIALSWLAAAIVLDLLRADIRGTPELRTSFTRRLPPVLDLFVGFAVGPRGWTVQLLLAIGATVLIAVTVLSTSLVPGRLRRVRLGAVGRSADRRCGR